MTKEEAVQKAHRMYAYEISEQSDNETDDFDALWQSLYDVCQIATYGILEDIEQDEIDEALQWLKDTQSLTQLYQDKYIYF